MPPHDATDWAAWQADFITQFKRGRGRRRTGGLTADEVGAVHAAEWKAAPVETDGSFLVAEIEAYLAFFAIARRARG